METGHRRSSTTGAFALCAVSSMTSSACTAAFWRAATGIHEVRLHPPAAPSRVMGADLQA